VFSFVLAPGRWKEVCRFLKDNQQSDMNMLTDLTAVDFPDRDPRFEIVAHLYSLTRGHRLRLKARVGDRDGDSVEIDTLTELWASANWLERECFDMFGVKFLGHPDLRRILTYPEFEGHPLRKDYPADRIQPLVQYRDVPNIDKVAPFGVDEGMSFGRQTHKRGVEDDDSRMN
jgi:NADH-quinone oxidoreductase subunit C